MRKSIYNILEQPTPQEARAYILGWLSYGIMAELTQRVPNLMKLPFDTIDAMMIELMNHALVKLKCSKVDKEEYKKWYDYCVNVVEITKISVSE